jgi:hypothetical protein
MEALRLNKKSNKGKEKVVEESGMETALNAFERGGRGRGRGSRDRDGRGRGAGLNPNTQHYSIQTTITINHHSTQFNYSPPPQQTKPNKMKCWNCEKEEHGVWDCPKDLKQSVRIRMKEAQ